MVGDDRVMYKFSVSVHGMMKNLLVPFTAPSSSLIRNQLIDSQAKNPALGIFICLTIKKFQNA